MNKYIVGYGWVTDVVIVYADTREAARLRAVEMSKATGLSAEEAAEPDISWAIDFDIWSARDLGLAVWDESFDARAAPMAGRPKDGWEVAEARK